MLYALSARYRYDVSYMRHLLEASPSAFFKFIAVSKPSRHAEAAPKEALFAAKLVGAMTEDCGPCVQIVVDMAREAGVPDVDIAAVLSRDIAAMSEAARIGFQFADRVARREDADEFREEARGHWGDKGVIDLTFALQVSRLYPMTKAGLGYAKECVRVTVGDRPVAVAKAA
jgi:alkylhydroperoxidase family enzyme